MADLTNEIAKLRNATYGEEVRESFISALKKLNEQYNAEIDVDAINAAAQRAVNAARQAESAAAGVISETPVSFTETAYTKPQTGDELGSIIGKLVSEVDSIRNDDFSSNEYYYEVGDTFATRSYCIADASVVSSQIIILSIVTDKSMKNINGISTNVNLGEFSLNGQFRGVSGRIGSYNGEIANYADIRFTMMKSTDRLLTLRLDFNNPIDGAIANTVCVFAGTFKFTFV